MSFVDRTNRLPPKKNCSICKGKGFVHVRDCPCTHDQKRLFGWSIWVNADSTHYVTIPDSHVQLSQLTRGMKNVHRFKVQGNPLDPHVARKAFDYSRKWQDEQ